MLKKVNMMLSIVVRLPRCRSRKGEFPIETPSKEEKNLIVAEMGYW